MNKLKYFILSAFVLMTIACGGGGSGGSGATSVTPTITLPQQTPMTWDSGNWNNSNWN